MHWRKVFHQFYKRKVVRSIIMNVSQKRITNKNLKGFLKFYFPKGKWRRTSSAILFVVLINSVSNWEEGSPDSSNCIMQSVTKSKKKFACCEKKKFLYCHYSPDVDHWSFVVIWERTHSKLPLLSLYLLRACEQ